MTVDDVLDHLLPDNWRDEGLDDGRAGRRPPSGVDRWLNPHPASAGPAQEQPPVLHGHRPGDVRPVLRRLARFLGTGTFLFWQTLTVDHLDHAEPGRGQLPVGPVPVHPAQPGVLDPGRVRGAADPAGPEPPGRPGPDLARGGPVARGADQGGHRVPGPRAGRAAGGHRRGRHPRLPARRAGPTRDDLEEMARASPRRTRAANGRTSARAGPRCPRKASRLTAVGAAPAAESTR